MLGATDPVQRHGMQRASAGLAMMGRSRVLECSVRYATDDTLLRQLRRRSQRKADFQNNTPETNSLPPVDHAQEGVLLTSFQSSKPVRTPGYTHTVCIVIQTQHAYQRLAANPRDHNHNTTGIPDNATVYVTVYYITYIHILFYNIVQYDINIHTIIYCKRIC